MNTRKLIAALLVALALSAAACESDEVVTPLERVEVEKVPDYSQVTSRTTAHMYDPDNPFTVATLEDLLERRDVDRVVAQFEAAGMQLSPGESFVVEGVSEGVPMQATLVVFAEGERPGESGILACIETGGEWTLAPAVFTSTPASPSPVKVTDNLWLDPAPFAGPHLAPEDGQRWSPDQWNSFWQCMLIHAPAQMATCFTTCYFAGPAYNACVLTCVATQAVASVVSCAVGVTIANSGGKEPRVQ